MRKMSGVEVWAHMMLAVVALIASTGFYSFPLTEIPIGTDSAVFSYIGSAMAQGAVPYLDVFDHKGPLVYVLNLVGAMGRSTWVLWLVEWAFLAASLGLGYEIGRTMRAPRLVAVAVPVLLVPYIVMRAEGGNMSEEYCLPFMLGVILACARTVQGAPLRAIHSFACGLCCGCVLMLKFTAVAGLVPLMIVALWVVWVKRGPALALTRAGAFIIGSVLVVAVFCGWLAANGALGAFVDDYVLFNLSYASATSAASRMESLAYFAVDPALLLVIASTGAAIALCWARKEGRCGREIALLGANFSGLVLAFGLAASSGRSYGHYFLTFVALYFIALNAVALQVWCAARNRAPLAVLGCVVALALVYFPSGLALVNQIAYRHDLASPRAEVSASLKNIAGEGEMLVVGNECWLYLDGGFRAPKPYAYRSDAMTGEYDAWLSGVIAHSEAPEAIAVAEYVDLEVELEGYRLADSLHGFEVYAREV